jgi:hypothetical protein
VPVAIRIVFQRKRLDLLDKSGLELVYQGSFAYIGLAYGRAAILM